MYGFCSSTFSTLSGKLQRDFLETDVNTCILQSVLPALVKRGLSPNLQTFCNLAIACHREKDGLQLLSDLKVINSAAWGLSCRKRQSEALMLLKRPAEVSVVSGCVLTPKTCNSRVGASSRGLSYTCAGIGEGSREGLCWHCRSCYTGSGARAVLLVQEAPACLFLLGVLD